MSTTTRNTARMLPAFVATIGPTRRGWIPRRPGLVARGSRAACAHGDPASVAERPRSCVSADRLHGGRATWEGRETTEREGSNAEVPVRGFVHARGREG